MTGNSSAERSISAGQINTKEIYQDNKTVIINLRSEKAVCETRWKAKHENIPQPTNIDIETLKTLLKELFPESLTHVRWECMVFCFEHESMEDAMGMIVQHANIKKDILHFLQKLDPSIDDIVMEVEVRELSESEEQTAETSASSDPSLKPLVKGQDSDRHASSDPSQGHSQSERYPRLSTASRATRSRPGRDLYFASRDGDLEEVKRLLSTPGVDVDCRVGSRTPVMAAAHWGHRDVVELLVSEGADVSLVDVVGDNTLHLACMGGDVETVEFVLSLNVVDIDARNRRGLTAADVARDWGPQRVVKLLKSRGAQ